ncbi:YggS family pyridoxal phosphate-dependent enzyme [Neisseriaceae bacterium PsAf]|nr:YggS family pyridoxal phosphate-dependent enzyme [Neisseriaceae bacterium PsAf]
MDNKQENLQGILNRIETAKVQSKREDEIKLIAVSKKFPVKDIQEFYDLGLRDFAENYIQEWNSKIHELSEDIIWHVIGNVQSNKTKWVAENADWLQTLDRESIARRIENQRPDDKAPLNVCIEINISRSAQKSGIFAEQLEDLVEEILPLKKICLRGLMCIPEAQDVNKKTEEMHQMQEIFLKLQQSIPEIDTLSMGMSADLELAIKYGSTMVRVGTALFGRRK